MAVNWPSWDPNSVRRKCKMLKFYKNCLERLEKEMDKIEDKLKILDWSTEENRIERMRCYQQLGAIMEYYRMDRASVKFYQEELLENANITG